MKFRKIPSEIKEYLHNLIAQYAKQRDIAGKLERLNSFANANPKQTAGLTFIVLCSLLFLTLIVSLIRNSGEDNTPPFAFSQIEDISPIISKKQQIEEIKQQQEKDVKNLLLQGRTLRKELDSLLSLPNKSYYDSLELFRKHKQLELIVRHLNEKD